MVKKSIVVASNNQKKVTEIKRLLSDFEVKSLKEIGCHDDIPETANTFEGNALLKAKHIVDLYQIPCFSDDSGLVVEALNGEPGIFSARYAGEDKDDDKNMDKLLENLAGQDNRKAYFITVICYFDGKEEHYFEGKIHGKIGTEKVGDNGFGYDPIFIPEGGNRTFAEFTAEEKNNNSHRGKAIAKLVDFLKR